MPILLALSALFSASETALFRLNPLRVRQLAAGADRRGAWLASLLKHPGNTLSMLLMCNTTVNVSFTTVLMAVILASYERNVTRYQLELITTGISTVLILFWGEILPKTLAAQSPGFLALRIARPMALLLRLLGPVARLLETVAMQILPRNSQGAVRAPYRVTQATMELAVDLGTAQGTLEEDEGTMIRGAIEAGDTKAREIMTPRPDVIRLAATATVREAAEVIVSTGYSRLPVYQDNVDNMVGVVYVRELLPLVQQGQLDLPVAKIARPPYFVPETKLASDLLREMKSRGEPLAIVLDEYGGTAGVVTLEDVVEEIVGDIIDEFDSLETEVAQYSGGYVFAARLLLEEINEQHGLTLPTPADVDTLGGLVYSLAGRVPRLGESVRIDGYNLTVDELRGSRIVRVRVTPSAGEDAVPDQAAAPNEDAAPEAAEKPEGSGIR